jgi:hypothetical protein
MSGAYGVSKKAAGTTENSRKRFVNRRRLTMNAFTIWAFENV